MENVLNDSCWQISLRDIRTPITYSGSEFILCTTVLLVVVTVENIVEYSRYIILRDMANVNNHYLQYRQNQEFPAVCHSYVTKWSYTSSFPPPRFAAAERGLFCGMQNVLQEH